MDAGLDGSNAGTSLRASLLKLNNPAKQQQKIMKELGFSLTDTEGNAKSLSEIVGDLEKSLEGETEAQKVATLGKLVGTEAVSGFLALMKAGPGVISKNTKALENSAGASKEAADKMMAGIGGALEELSGAFESAAILIGDQLVPYIQKFAKAIGGIVDKFNEASPEFQKFAVLGTAVSAGLMLIVGPILLLIGFIPAIISGFGAIATVLGITGGAAGLLTAALGVLTGPVGLAIAAIAGITLAGVALVKHLKKDAIPEIDRFGEGVSEATQKALGSFFELSDGASATMAEMSMGNRKVTEEMATDLIGKYKSMNEQILAAVTKRHEDELASTQALFDMSSVLTAHEEAAILQSQKNAQDLQVLSLEAKEKRVAEIMTTASKEKRTLTQSEQDEINNIQRSMNEKAVEYMTKGEVEQKIIMERLKETAGDLSARQAAEVVLNSAKQRDGTVKEAEKQYDQTVAKIIRMRDETGEITSEQATKMIGEATRARDGSVKQAEKMHAEVVSEAKAQAGEHIESVNWETGQILSKWEVYKTGVLKKIKETNAESLADFKRWGTSYDAWYAGHRAKATEGWKKYGTDVMERIRTTNSESLADFKRWGTNYDAWYAGFRSKATAGWKNYGDGVMTRIRTTNAESIADFKRWGTNLYNVISGAWNKVMTFFKGIDLLQTGKDIVNGLVKGIGDTFGKVKAKVSELATLIPDWARNILGIHSPSRVFAEIGKYIGQGLSGGISDSKRGVIGAMTGVLAVLIAGTKTNAAEVAAITKDGEKQRIEIQKEYAAKRAELARKTEQSAQSALKTSKNKKGQIVITGTKRVHEIHANASASLTKLKADEAKKLAALSAKTKADIVKNESENSKERLEAIKRFVDDKKSLEQLSLVAESEVWRRTLDLFKVGTKERVEAQKAYQASLKAINDEIVKVNDEYAGKMSAINDKLRKDEEDLTNLYTKTLGDRMNSLMSFAGLFDEFDVKVEKSGADLLANLGAQVDGFKLWQTEIEKLSGKAIDEGLIAELREMGPKALPQLLALNSMTDEQMSQYSALYQEKSKLARTQAEAELVGMKADTQKRITELRATANVELEALRVEWVNRIKAVTKATNDELLSLKSIGANAGKGLMDGLASMEPALVAKAKSIAEAVKKAMASAFDIHSPSRWMRDFIGVNMMRGWIDGMSSMRGSVLAMTANASGWMTPEVPKISGYQTPKSGAGVGRAVVSGSTQGSGGNAGGIVQNIEIHSTTPLSPAEIARKQKQASQQLAMEWGMR